MMNTAIYPLTFIMPAPQSTHTKSFLTTEAGECPHRKLSKEQIEQQRIQSIRSCLDQMISSAHALFGSKGDKEHELLLTEFMEPALREIVSKAAVQIKILHCPRNLIDVKRLHRLLTPSLRRVTGIADASGRIWNSITTYLRPVYIAAKMKSPNIGNIDRGDVSLLAWHVYQVLLAARLKGEASLSPNNALTNIRLIQRSFTLSSEAKARLAVISGIFSTFEKHSDVPSIRFLPSVGGQVLVDRLEDILNDPLLIEASQLRRFWALKSNVASVKRDLRLLLRSIRDNSRWARGIINIFSQPCFQNPMLPEMAKKLIDFVPSTSKLHFPVLTPQVEALNRASTALIEARPSIKGYTIRMNIPDGESDRIISITRFDD